MFIDGLQDSPNKLFCNKQTNIYLAAVYKPQEGILLSNSYDVSKLLFHKNE
jgi:hypothetical protein